MPHVKLVRDVPEGGSGNVVVVSRSRATDLVNAGMAQRILERAAAADPMTQQSRSKQRGRHG